jgi:hypothetical protein
MPTYPNEVYPSDSAVEALDGAFDAASGLAYIAKGVGPNSSPTYEVQYNRREQRQNAILAPLNQGRVVDEGGLNIGVFPVVFYFGQVRKAFDGATGQAMTDNATRYVWIDASNALATGAAFPADTKTFLPLARVVTANGDIVSIEDERGAVLFHVPD